MSSVRIWLVVLIGMIWGIIAVGGLTRLTESGLSIVEWKPIVGTLPPMSGDDWQREFDEYQRYPQYQLQPIAMDRFKTIYFWEYLHRLLGRLLGLVFLVPFVWFAFKKRLDARDRRRLFFAFILGGLQGALGWYMVKSGLVAMPRVSHLRLAAHLSLALFLACWLLWIYWDHVPALSKPLHPTITIEEETGGNQDHPSYPAWMRPYSLLLLLMVGMQIIYGAFTSGLRAGHMFNTFPKMAGYWLPPSLFEGESFWQNAFHNPMTVQWIHRVLALVLCCLIIPYCACLLSGSFPQKLKRNAKVLLGLLGLQIILGVLTLLHLVPIPLASAHQMGAVLLLSSVVFNLYLMSHPKRG